MTISTACSSEPLPYPGDRPERLATMVKKAYSGAMWAEIFDASEAIPPTYQRAIDVTIDLIAERGVKGTSLRDIGAAANVNFGNLSSYFGGKERLIAECFRQVAKASLEMERAYFQQAQALALPPEYGTNILWDLCEAAGTRYRKQSLVMMELALSAESNPVFEEIMSAWFAERTAIMLGWGQSIGLSAPACHALNFLTLAEGGFYLSCGKSLLYRVVAQASLAEAFASCSGIKPVGIAETLPDLARTFYGPALPDAPDPRKEGPLSGTRAQIVETATDVLIEHGLDGITTRLVAQQAGISLGLITYHFPSVTALALAALNRLCERSIDQLDDPDTRHPILERLLGEQRRHLTLPRGSLQAYRGFLQLALTAGRLPSQAALGQALRRKMGHVVMRAMDVSFPEPGSRTLAGSFALISAPLFTIVPAMQSRELPFDLPELLHFLTYRLLGFERTPAS